MTLRLHNTLTRQVEDFQPLQPGRVSLYTCGPTVYNYAHIGNFRTFLFEDLLRRWNGGWKIARRKIVLDQSVLLAKNLTVFF